ncbi:DUF805 domain-containing protein [Aquabacterium sp. CECT 9606]|uniref:DUF805 domain-containing protein n=1 Tax=Aquabacterium sp. CECT 9606 TaxID=2845822 RepID=UPI001E4B8788|nr:DUF805 domain-containing protein [Aquabacterium sp. CECT 9606]CAH0352987.1 hypothetical protein AQB9606_02981 [Aquabacterium sp. CECT 9606]
MSVANPYQPPRADVADVRSSSTSYQPVKFWSRQGRVSRLQYLGYLMGGYLLTIAAAALLGGIAGALGFAKVAPFVGFVALVPYFVFSIIMLIQRTHDMGWSGWAALLALIPFAALVWMFKAGTPGENRFGAPPPPNTTSVKLLACTPVLIGILAAIALPAYQDYVQRAKAAQLQQQSAP